MSSLAHKSFTDFDQAPRASSRRRIEPSDIAFAREKRALRWGWQAIAGMLGVHQVDLQQAVELGLKPKAAAAPVPPTSPREVERRNAPNITRERSRPPSLLRGTMEHRALMAIAAGFGRPSRLSGMIDRAPKHASNLILVLREKGLVELGGGEWTLSAAGHAELERLK